MKRLLLLLVPLAIGVLAAGFRVLWLEPGGSIARFGLLAIGFAAVGYAFALLLGWPGWLLIRRWKLRAAWQVTLIGAALGGCGGALMPLVLGEARARHFFSGLHPYPLEYAFFGAVTAFAAWWVVLRGTGPENGECPVPRPTRPGRRGTAVSRERGTSD